LRQGYIGTGKGTIFQHQSIVATRDQDARAAIDPQDVMIGSAAAPQ